MEDNKINVRIPDGTGYGLSDIEAKAKKLGMNKSELIMKGVSMMMNFDEVFLKRIQGYSEGLHIPEWLVLQNMIIKRMADEAAHYEVYGNSTKLLDEFMLIGDGIERRSVTGEELFNSLKDQYVIKYERKLVEQALNEEKYGTLHSREKALLIKYRAGDTWRESEEYKQELERQALEKKQIEEIEKKYPEAARKQKEHIEKMKAERKAARSNFDWEETVTPEELAGWQKD
ncbi:hypothetical protein [Desulfosporosinus lacus]|uniref:Uncharacterized protein n=1 Tax=Desulfosporosinus lacus DSM 15449 TaxID=1121420 RepID=A0A1M5WHW2_9FIRM|nr:hypothetical protein [Desulfosporosinus lacus]SHH87085.1 hypothetical protein SAMN02746098_01626 [Desulfosporosinus lacus DSM 15449]